ncbi:MAG: DUF1648 domain-containing protein [Deltaproteobacteria bacterium]|nr:DUF1648 domain-containing protein [Deltaproteobacteria bacterium]
MRTFFILSFVANLALTLISLDILPYCVAVHFGPGAVPNGWGSKYVSALFFLVIQTVLFFSMYYSSRMIFTFPARWMNLPNKDYWLKDENKPRAGEIISKLMWQFGTALFLFLFIVNLLTIQANLSRPVRLDERAFIIALVMFFIFIGYWLISFVRSFRVPGEKVA